MVKKEYLKKIINATAINFQFELKEDFQFIFDMLFEKIKEQDQALITKKFQELWKLTNQERNDEFGFRGYPSLARWLEILASKPLTEIELQERKRKHEEKLILYAKYIVIWVKDPNLSISFLNAYKNPSNRHLKTIIDCYLQITEELPDERVVKMGKYLKKKYLEDEKKFISDMRNVANVNNQLLLT